MLNLLQKDQKKKIAREYRFRFLITALYISFVGEIIALILLVPPFLIAHTKSEILSSQSASLQVQNLTIETNNLTTEVQKTNTYINAFNSSTTPTGVVAAINNIVATHDSSVRLNGLVYKIQNGNQQIVVGGIAASRQALLDFIKRIKVQPGVISADLPVSDFANAKDINFSINILAKPQQI